jgi:hypothetical protein
MTPNLLNVGAKNANVNAKQINFSDGTIQTTAAGSGAVTSVFGRGGTVFANFGDYNFNLISGQLTEGQLPSVIDVGEF